MKKVMLVFGTRPEAIKMAPLYHALKREPEQFDTTVCVTAQHREMLDRAMETFQIVADIDLNLMTNGQDLFDITSSVLLNMRSVLNKTKPDIVFVHGDTTTTLASALACFYLKIPVWHIEAGLRTNDIWSPYPEEFNRQVVTKVSNVHIAPTNFAKNNLLKEGIPESQIIVTGNTVIDALISTLDSINLDPSKEHRIKDVINNALNFNWQVDKFVLITGHRRENFGEGFVEICSAIQELASRYPDLHFVYPMHLNPNVQKPVKDLLGHFSNIHLISPLDYEYFIFLLNACYFVMTDSGGIQEEAPSLGKPVLVLRDITERPEAVDAGTVLVVGADRDNIIKYAAKLIEDDDLYNQMAHSHNPYGDGKASERIIAHLIANLPAN
ncbi:UDP-N-acetylglucosamine 2-epimerase (non-hydrolyzing) [Gammaproteobacteria bacterium]|nr:UDP-N-acetylglucosamine 2-epimerase (non-hydrolyzing) [Gammaproteobacteria bacterium]|tara:strand:- start:1241 stop:2389 length:1149 start_codon:yes stop_codon:yes gene_type:complete